MKRIVMIGLAVSLLIAVAAVEGSATQINSRRSQSAALNALAEAAASESVLWSFGATTNDGTFPTADLIADRWGNLYGTTSGGGPNGLGTVFELNPPTGKSSQWSERVLWS